MIDKNLIPNTVLFKWIGGKSWLKEKLTKEYAKLNITNKSIYIEPFIGGMGSFKAILPILKENNIKKIILNDINKELIEVYKTVKKNHKELIKQYINIEKEFEDEIKDKTVYKLDKTKDKDKVKILLKECELYFKNKRVEYNILKHEKNLNKQKEIKKSAVFLFLQTHCFNGIYRENGKGNYNTPFNWTPNKKNLKIEEDKIIQYYHFFKNNDIIFENLDVFDLLKKYNNYKEITLYLDPPYLNISETNENKYNKEHFDKNAQLKLLEELTKYDSFIFSNHLNKIFENYFTQKNNSFITVNRKNIMTSKVENRKNDKIEILGKRDSN